jgi:hypothetical protein
MLTKTVDKSIREIRTYFPINLASRTTAKYIDQSTTINCESFMDEALVLEPLKTTICG